MTGLLRTILILVILYYGFKFLMRYIFPLFVKRTIDKMEDRMREEYEAQQPKAPEGEVSIDKMPKKDKPNKSDMGEYIDYEEIE